MEADIDLMMAVNVKGPDLGVITASRRSVAAAGGVISEHGVCQRAVRRCELSAIYAASKGCGRHLDASAGASSSVLRSG